MHDHTMHDAASQRRGELLAVAASRRLAARARRLRIKRISARRRVARALLSLGYFFVDAGHSLELGKRR
ncbi:MAG: hypothetical protein ACR2KS_04740 [Candidatus Eremiobacter antarcticus]|nr:hypothetical protein [Candidatus Eremiobacteraeota bacterium]MBC5807327.1 hypothetical protein [Candidatus Eremiobacteraeota bacterium]